MKIVFVGISCVGKSTVGKMLAKKNNYKFFDFDLEVEKYFDSHISFLKRDMFSEHDYRRKVRVVLEKILNENHDNFIISMPPSGLRQAYAHLFRKKGGIFTIVLKDETINIFNRLIFLDDYTKPIDVEISEEGKVHYLKEIASDNSYHRLSYKKANMHYHIDGKTAEQVVDDLQKILFKEQADNSILT